MLRHTNFLNLSRRLTVQIGIIAESTEDIVRMEHAMFCSDRINGEYTAFMPKVYVENHDNPDYSDDENSDSDKKRRNIRKINAGINDIAHFCIRKYREIQTKKGIIPNFDYLDDLRDLISCNTIEESSMYILRNDKDYCKNLPENVSVDFVFLSSKIDFSIIESHVKECKIIILVNGRDNDFYDKIHKMTHTTKKKDIIHVHFPDSGSNVENSIEIDVKMAYIARYYLMHQKVPDEFKRLIEISKSSEKNRTRMLGILDECRIFKLGKKIIQTIGSIIDVYQTNFDIYKNIITEIIQSHNPNEIKYIENIIDKLQYIIDECMTEKQKQKNKVEYFVPREFIKSLYIKDSKVKYDSWQEKFKVTLFWRCIFNRIDIDNEILDELKDKQNEELNNFMKNLKTDDLEFLLHTNMFYYDITGGDNLFSITTYPKFLEMITNVSDQIKYQNYFENERIHECVFKPCFIMISRIIEDAEKYLEEVAENMQMTIGERKIKLDHEDQVDIDEKKLIESSPKLSAQDLKIHEDIKYTIMFMASKILVDIILLAGNKKKYEFLIAIEHKIINNSSFNDNLSLLKIIKLIKIQLDKMKEDELLSMISKEITNKELITDREFRSTLMLCVDLAYICGNDKWIKKFGRNRNDFVDDQEETYAIEEDSNDDDDDEYFNPDSDDITDMYE